MGEVLDSSAPERIDTLRDYPRLIDRVRDILRAEGFEAACARFRTMSVRELGGPWAHLNADDWDPRFREFARSYVSFVFSSTETPSDEIAELCRVLTVELFRFREKPKHYCGGCYHEVESPHIYHEGCEPTWCDWCGDEHRVKDTCEDYGGHTCRSCAALFAQQDSGRDALEEAS